MTRQHVQDKNDVWNGLKKKTSSGLTKRDLMKNKNGRVVSKKQHKKGKELYRMMKKQGKLAEPFKSKRSSKSKRRSKRRSKSNRKSKKRSINNYRGGGKEDNKPVARVVEPKPGLAERAAEARKAMEARKAADTATLPPRTRPPRTPNVDNEDNVTFWGRT